MRVWLAIVVLFLLVAGMPMARAARVCTQDEAHHAEDDSVRLGLADRLSSWTEVYNSFNLYGHCDDGAIAEAYSDAIAIRLAEHWSSVNELLRYTRVNRSFDDFVIRHVDTLMTPKQAKTIIMNARKKCPSGGGQLCRLIIASIRNETNQR